jgi:hypothetical protein
MAVFLVLNDETKIAWKGSDPNTTCANGKNALTNGVVDVERLYRGC